jgi:hypothetical protein
LLTCGLGALLLLGDGLNPPALLELPAGLEPPPPPDEPLLEGCELPPPPPPLSPLCWALAESATNRPNAPFKATVIKYLCVFFMIV